ncbi:hypothetical protein CCAL9344_02075 [Campylobacter sp. RM9344]|uniref:Cytochrome c domain-containing protein n=1 Tax=Campylobacter californiensis TaxID=1032243 RepID=A0AAW3ZW72_9BACT|nr:MULTISPECIES: hypothetical protein [unclassified Campylobacter]MBE2984644.1 hypothetical protein [Campylobacter sp. RM6883]MBE2986835.1 hypothetical protein [Campylobacter sp. RM12919]MBE2988487.1 hypothetical protein [Campylobacter sp. RM12920]MBE2995068.1 hypothetical protein [Campylobacter sp. RM6913]MBE3028989.1 hypothetical protein [Campylobacter sp. RM9344]
MRKILATLIIASFACGADLFVGSMTPVLDKVGGKVIAELHAGAKLKQISQNGEYVEVEYVGFIPGESPIAYARVGVLEQDINVGDMKTFKVIKTHKDPYDNEWDEVSVKGFVKKDTLVADIDVVHKAGQALFEERCGSCHALHAYDEFGANVWPSVIETMISNSALTPQEVETLNRFLQSKAPIE